jgi:hypothetical protein
MKEGGVMAERSCQDAGVPADVVGPFAAAVDSGRLVAQTGV